MAGHTLESRRVREVTPDWGVRIVVLGACTTLGILAGLGYFIMASPSPRRHEGPEKLLYNIPLPPPSTGTSMLPIDSGQSDSANQPDEDLATKATRVKKKRAAPPVKKDQIFLMPSEEVTEPSLATEPAVVQVQDPTESTSTVPETKVQAGIVVLAQKDGPGLVRTTRGIQPPLNFITLLSGKRILLEVGIDEQCRGHVEKVIVYPKVSKVLQEWLLDQSTKTIEQAVWKCAHDVEDKPIYAIVSVQVTF